MRVQGRPWSNEIEQSYQVIAINWTHGILHDGPISKSSKLRLNLHGTILEGKSISLNPKKNTHTHKKRAHDLKNQEPS